MPNGGSDCCGTCWFNARNDREAGDDHARDRQPPFCTIRSLAIEKPYYTYCANHPHRRPVRDPIPIGPVFTGDAEGRRQIWRPSPDTEQVRCHLLELLARIEEQPRSEYPIGIYADELVVWQLGEFGEVRAVEELRRLILFDPAARENGPFRRTRHAVVQIARDALEKIEGSHRDSAPS